MISYQCDLLWSINERLGGNPGLSFERLSHDWIDDMVDLAKLELDAIEDAKKR